MSLKPPILVGLEHDRGQDNQEQYKRTQEAYSVAQIIEVREKKGLRGRLFIEGTPSFVKECLNKASIGDYPGHFGVVIRAAKEAGWEIIPLNKDSITRAYPMEINSRFEDLQHSFVNLDLRERQWVRRVLRANPNSNDLIVMHPMHISGFVRKSGLPFKPLFLSKSRILSNGSFGVRRLSVKEKIELRRLRLKERMKRIRLNRNRK